MKILRSTNKVVVNNSSSPETQSIDFQYNVAIHAGQQLLHNLDTLSPTITAVDSSGNPVTNLYVTPVTTDENYTARQLSSLGFASGNSFTGKITLSK